METLNQVVKTAKLTYRALLADDYSRAEARQIVLRINMLFCAGPYGILRNGKRHQKCDH